MQDKDKEYIRDGLGWIDDFRAPAGMVGQPFVRQLYIHSLLNDDVTLTLQKLYKHQYNKEEVRVVLNMLLD